MEYARQGPVGPSYDQLWHETMTSVPVSSSDRTVLRSFRHSVSETGTYTILNRHFFLKEHTLSSPLTRS